jgi:hypothetical protein
MPTNTILSAARLAATVLLVLLLNGCADKIDSTSTSSAPASPAVSKPATTSAAVPTATTVPSMTAEELAWLKAVATLHNKVDKAFMETGNVYLTRAKMRSYANTLRSCSRELARIGSPGDRLQPVYVMVKQACQTFEKGAKCWDTAIRVSDAGGAVTGTANERTFTRASQCGFEAQGNGSNLLGSAKAKGEEIKAKVG